MLSSALYLCITLQIRRDLSLLSEDLQMEIVFLLTSLIPGSTSNLISNLYFGLDKFSAINSNADISRKRNIEVNRWVYWIIYALIKFISCVRVRVAGESFIDIFKLFLQLLWIIHEREFYMKSFFILLTLGCTSGFSPLPPHVSYGWREMHFARLRSSAQAQENNFTQENREFHLNKILHIYSQPAVLEKQIERKRQNNWIKNKLHCRPYLRVISLTRDSHLWGFAFDVRDEEMTMSLTKSNVWKWSLDKCHGSNSTVVPRACMW